MVRMMMKEHRRVREEESRKTMTRTAAVAVVAEGTTAHAG
jgi:hypothetical protein